MTNEHGVYVRVLHPYGDSEPAGAETDISHWWPFIPRVGDTFVWTEPIGEGVDSPCFSGRVSEVRLVTGDDLEGEPFIIAEVRERVEDI